MFPHGSFISMAIWSVLILSYVISVTLSLRDLSTATDTLTSIQSINENGTLVSPGGKFQLGLFSPGSSKKRYVGIWYNNIPNQTIVWVANRENPLNDTSGVLKIGSDGNLLLLDGTEQVVWSTKIQNISSVTTALQLLDSGNLVLRGESSTKVENFLWQSFDHPCDTLLPGMKLGWDLETRLNRKLTSSKSTDDPSPGEYTFGLELQGLPQLVQRKGSVKQLRSGAWDGVQFRGLMITPNHAFISKVNINLEVAYYEFDLYNESTLVRMVLNYSEAQQPHVWNSSRLEWLSMPGLHRDQCDDYANCGPNSICDTSDPQVCSCLTGYVPKSSQDWDMLLRYGGCIRANPLNCPEGEEFIELTGMRTPDLLQFYMNASISLEECRLECLKNCTCTAYASASGAGSGCLLWFGDLIDISKLKEYGNQKLYIRAAATDQGAQPVIQATDDSLELPIFSMVTIAEATHNFSYSNKIGEGGFGTVYKGMLLDGQEIAVKRLSRSSHQGLAEFKTEVMLIAKLQHRNLVRFLGCCIDGEERMLVYEYMPNRSLDSFIFGTEKRANIFCVWRKRFDVIVGISCGLLYLHRDSRLRIIHRDLKASNVLLDSEMNPKFSDFGMARALGGDQSLAKTTKVVGTYGYMSPEYAINGIYSVKSDVFSFGVLVLEIVSGKRNREFHYPEHDFNLLGHAWKLWTEEKALQLVDPQMEDSFPMPEVLRCIQVGLLCVQQCPEDRPPISSVLLMLDTENAMLSQPKHPGFYTGRSLNETELLLGERIIPATNEMTNTLLFGR